MQIAGNECKVCGRSIIFSNEGKFCGQCGTVVHLSCESESKCKVCGQAYEGYEPQKANLLRDLVVARAARENRSDTWSVAMVLMVGLAVLLLIVRFLLL